MTTGTFIGIVLAITVFAVICIVTDSFFFFKDKPGPYFVMFLFVIAVNLLIALGNIAEGIPFLTDGLLNVHSLNLFVVAAFIPIYITLIVKYLHDKRHAETE